MVSIRVTKYLIFGVKSIIPMFFRGTLTMVVLIIVKSNVCCAKREQKGLVYFAKHSETRFLENAIYSVKS